MDGEEGVWRAVEVIETGWVERVGREDDGWD